MGCYEIEQMMYEYDNQIKKLMEEIEELNNKQKETEVLLNKVRKIKTLFHENHNHRVEKINRIKNLQNISMARIYVENMQGLLNGRNFINTETGLSDAIVKTKKYIMELEDEIMDKKEKVECLHDRYAALQTELIQENNKRE